MLRNILNCLQINQNDSNNIPSSTERDPLLRRNNNNNNNNANVTSATITTTAAAPQIIHSTSSTTKSNVTCDEMGLNNNNIQTTAGQTEDITWSIMILNGLCHFICILFTIFITYLGISNEIILFTWHPIFMTIGYFLLMTEAILCFSDYNFVSNKLGYKQKVFLHWILHTVAACSIEAGFLIIIINKNRADKYHFQTYHAIFGLVTLILTAASIGGGLLAKYSFPLRGYLRPVYSKLLHSTFGLCSYVLSMVTIILSFYSNWFTDNTGTFTWYTSFIIVLFIGLYTICKPLCLIVSRIKGAFFRSSL